MKIMITGATGFVGQNLTRYLEVKNITDIKVLSRQALASVSVDDLEAVDVIVHLAGKAHDLKRVSDPEEYHTVNFGLTKKLFDAFIGSDAQKFIFISSVKASADVVAGILKEEDAAQPATPYGRSKLLAEDYICSRVIPQGKSYYILRPCMIHGPGNKGNLNLLYKLVKKGIPYPLGGFNNKRSFLSVENLCFVINELAERADIASGTYQVSDDEALSTNEVVNILATSLNTKPRVWKISRTLIMFLAKIGDMLHLPLTTERLNKLTENYLVSNQKIKNAINKEFPLSAVKGLKITADSFNRQ